MARTTSGGPAAHRVLPRRLHRAPAVAEIAAQNKAVVYGLLFRTVAETLRTIAADPRHLGAEIGFFAVLHTWGQTLVHHPHLHCVIPGGGLANDGSGWVACRPGFFLPVRVLSRYFRRVLLAALEDAFESGRLRFAGRLQPLADSRRFAEHLRPARQTEWVVYAKRPFAGPEQVLDYLGRYTHRIAISNQRLRSLDDGTVRFRYTDYRSKGASRRKTMTLAAAQFIRRMLLHVLPPGFHRIRHYGFLANRARQRKLRGHHLFQRAALGDHCPYLVADGVSTVRLVSPPRDVTISEDRPATMSAARCLSNQPGRQRRRAYRPWADSASLSR